METWEKILRHELEELVPDGLYTIGEGEFKAQTGRGGYIDYRVELCRSLFFDTTENPTNNESSAVKSKYQIKGEELEDKCIEALDKIEDDTINFSPAYIANRWGKPFQFMCGLTPKYKEVPCCAVCENTMIIYPMNSARPYCNICDDLVDEGTTKILI